MIFAIAAAHALTAATCSWIHVMNCGKIMSPDLRAFLALGYSDQALLDGLWHLPLLSTAST
jgi:hypothetical protein